VTGRASPHCAGQVRANPARIATPKKKELTARIWDDK